MKPFHSLGYLDTTAYISYKISSNIASDILNYILIRYFFLKHFICFLKYQL